MSFTLNQTAIRMDGNRGALWQTSLDLEEGCHSAGFIATFHK